MARAAAVGFVVLVGLVAACSRSKPSATAGASPSLAASASDAAAPSAATDQEPQTKDHPAMEGRVVCGMAVAGHGESRPGIVPFARESGGCSGNFCDVADVPPKGADSCFVATSNISRAEREIARGPRGAAVQSQPWDHASAPRYLDRVESHLHLARDESALLKKNGFVVLDRASYDSYAVAFHDVFQQQLPVYVSVDAIFNAVFHGTETVLGEVEKTKLGPKLVRMIDAMRATLLASRARYDAETADDLDLYLVVAHRLLHDSSIAAARSPAVEQVASALVAEAKGSGGLETIDIFGRERIIDFSQYEPRGHYANGGYGDGFDVKPSRAVDGGGAPDEHISMREYFRAMTWLSRIELNLVSRSCRSSQPGADVDPSETPREARDAIALADLLGRSGALADLRSFDDVYTVFAGSREDVPLPVIASLAAKGGFGPRDAEAPAKLRAAIGDGWRRTARTHFMPDGATELPAITTMFGPRIVPDVAPLTHLTHPAVPGRATIRAADVGYMLGHDRAKAYLGVDLAEHPSLAAALDASRTDLAAGTRGKTDVYSTWMGAALHLADRPTGSVPSFMRTDAYSDLRMSSALAVYAQIRHTFVLVAGQGYDGYGCEIPDGWVEPALPAYDALLSWVRAARAAAPSQAAYFRRVEEVLGMLRTISAAELSGAPLTEPQRRWLGMVSEYTPLDGYGGDSGEPPKYTGWYFDLFPDREIGAERGVDLIADWFTLTNADQVRYLGIEKAAMGVFVVDTGGVPRAMVGPVAKTYELASPIEARLDDEHAREAKGKEAAWLSSYLVPKKEDPSVRAQMFVCDDDVRVVVDSARPVTATVTLLDHHGDPLGKSMSTRVTSEPAIVAFSVPKAVRLSKNGIEGMHVHLDDGAVAGQWDFVTGVSAYRGPGPFDLALGSMKAPR